jgi:polyisoprenoid-binding protein YceI
LVEEKAMSRALRALVLSVALSAATFAVAHAQGTQPNGLPPGVFVGEADYKQAPAGTYALDPDHASVIARVSHLRYSWSVFRFDRVSGTLTWDPVTTTNSSLTAKIQTASITSNVKGFSEQLASDGFLKSAAFPEATFVSSAFRQMSSRRGKVDGQLTLMGKTRPVTFDVELVGAGKGFGTGPRIGANARTSINPVDFGLPALLGEAIEIVIDVEFQKNP